MLLKRREVTTSMTHSQNIYVKYFSFHDPITSSVDLDEAADTNASVKRRCLINKVDILKIQHTGFYYEIRYEHFTITQYFQLKIAYFGFKVC